MKNFSVFLLTVILAASSLLAACGSDAGAASSAVTEKTTVDTDETTALGPLDFIPAGTDLDDMVFRIYNSSPYAEQYNEVAVEADEFTQGDIVSEAVYRRNLAVEEKLNVDIQSILEAPSDNWKLAMETAQRQVMSGDTTYTAICTQIETAYLTILSGSLLNLKKICTINTENSWWDSRQNDCMTYFGDRLYTLAGDINFLDNYGTSCIFLNRTMCENQGLEVPYETVKNGGWTIDFMNQMYADTYVDINGDGKKDMDDRYGYSGNVNVISRMMNGFGMGQVYMNEENIPTVDETEKVINAIDLILEKVTNDNNFFNGKYDGAYADIFFDGRCMFMEDNFAALVVSRSKMDDDPTVFPYPKMNESQDGYYCPVNDSYGTVYGLLANIPDPEAAGLVLEAMGAASVDTVTTEVIEKNCMVKAARDEQTADMITIIFKSTRYSQELICDWNDMTRLLWDTAEKGKNNYATKLAKVIGKINAAITSDMDVIGGLD